MDSVVDDMDDLDRLFNDEVIESMSSTKSQSSTDKTEKNVQISHSNSDSNKSIESTKETKKRPRMPKMKNILPTLIMPPLEPIQPIQIQSPRTNSNLSSVFDSQTIGNGNNIPSISSSSSFSNSIQNIEDRIGKYLDTQLNNLANDFIRSLHQILDQANDYSHVITRFNREMKEIIKKEISFNTKTATEETFLFPTDIKINLRKINRISYLPLQQTIEIVHKKRKEISDKEQSENKEIQQQFATYKKVIHERNKAYKHFIQARTDNRQIKKNIIYKEIQLETQKRIIEEEISKIKNKQKEIIQKKEKEQFQAIIKQNQGNQNEVYHQELRDFVAVIPKTLNRITDILSDQNPVLEDIIQENVNLYDYTNKEQEQLFQTCNTLYQQDQIEVNTNHSKNFYLNNEDRQNNTNYLSTESIAKKKYKIYKVPIEKSLNFQLTTTI